LLEGFEKEDLLMDCFKSMGWRAKVGLILPSVNTVTEPVFYSLAPQGVTFHASRVYISGTGVEDVIAMEKENARAIGELYSAKVDCMVDCCTASGMIKGLDHDKAFCTETEEKYGVPATSTIQSIIMALRLLGIHRLVIVTPYPDEVDRIEYYFISL